MATPRGLRATRTPAGTDADPIYRELAKARFDHAARGGGWPMEWQEATGSSPVEGFTQQAFHADLLVLGQRDPRDATAFNVPADFVDAVMLESGRPALVLPYHSTPPRDGIRNVVVAWQPNKAAARALDAALPLLVRATEVHLVTWSDDAAALQPMQQEVMDHLRLHGVTGIQPHAGPIPASTGRSLLSLASGVGADLLVMGCYGRGRWREWALGGASLTVLREITLPVLMAH
jgi:nucleotide-binding universal stress UspA family protein